MKLHNCFSRQLIVLTLLLASCVIAHSQSKGADFKLALESEKSNVQLGQPIFIKTTRTNITTNSIDDSHPANPVEYLTINVVRNGSQVSETEQGRSRHSNRTTADWAIVSSFYFGNLKPGESSHQRIELSFYYDMSKPGVYTITVSQRTHPEHPEMTEAVESNTITITVDPVGDPVTKD